MPKKTRAASGKARAFVVVEHIGKKPLPASDPVLLSLTKKAVSK
jgi:hypothetical protein